MRRWYFALICKQASKSMHVVQLLSSLLGTHACSVVCLGGRGVASKKCVSSYSSCSIMSCYF